MEDRINKPWRVGPTGRLAPDQMRKLLIVAMPCILAASFYLGAWQESALHLGLAWMYNDLQAGETIIGRNLIISIAFALYNGASLRIASGPDYEVHQAGFSWLLIISAVVLSTMHVQELKDVAGDKVRNRRTVPLVFGDSVARWSVAVPVLAWSVICPLYLRLGLLGFVLPVTLGVFVACWTLWTQNIQAARLSWQIWALWLISLYVLPLIKDHSVFKDTHTL